MNARDKQKKRKKQPNQPPNQPPKIVFPICKQNETKTQTN